jgi:2-polyprenyl-3-methyl-5-hydroxy-6-metoxy-1,4-benzoquinol methylase
MHKSAYDELYKVEEHHWWTQGLHDLVLSLLVNNFENKPLQILDAGCGTGGLISHLASQGHDVTGVDVSDVALNYCRKRNLNGKIIQADLNTWVPEPNRYDLITCLDVLYHDWVNDEVAILKKIASGLKKGGLLILDYPAFPMLARQHCQIVMGKRRYTKKMLKKILRAAGLLPTIMSYRLPYAVPPLLLKRVFEGIQNGNIEKNSDIANISPWNKLLFFIHCVENKIVTNGISLPFGSSLFAVVKNRD